MRLTDQICGHVKIGATGIRWVCVRPPHGPDDPLPPGVDPHWWSQVPHYFVHQEEAR